jgi:2-hydroxycyclohexanecarboxyl-CoA dehydrogenase
MSDSSNAAASWQQATSLVGKSVVVTGGASGIGRATALQFASAGAKVLIGDVNVEQAAATAKQIRAAGGEAESLPLDLTDGASIDAFVDQVMTRLGGAPDILASVAGVDKVMPFLDNTPDVWELLTQVNYLGPVRMIHRFLPKMMERRGGKIVTVASDAGRVGSSGESFYAGTKGAVIAFTKSLAREVARAGITCNCVAPGPTDTPLFNGTIPEGSKLRDALIKAIPLRRLAQPAEIANTIVYFATPATDFMTGQVVSVSGGLTMHG